MEFPTEMTLFWFSMTNRFKTCIIKWFSPFTTFLKTQVSFVSITIAPGLREWKAEDTLGFQSQKWNENSISIVERKKKIQQLRLEGTSKKETTQAGFDYQS